MKGLWGVVLAACTVRRGQGSTTGRGKGGGGGGDQKSIISIGSD